MAVKITYFVHGTTTDNQQGLATGWLPGELTFGGKYEIIRDKCLRECNYGAVDGKPARNFKSHMEDFINTPFPNGESYKDVETRIASFVDFLRNNYDGKHVAIVAHQAPQLALEVLLRGKGWQQAIAEDWRKCGDWQPGWDYKSGV